MPTYDLTSGIHLMVIHCAAAERGGLIKNKEKKRKESTSVKLKAFRHLSDKTIGLLPFTLRYPQSHSIRPIFVLPQMICQ